MGGFKKLKEMMQDLDDRHLISFDEIPNDEAEKHFELHCLFEIAGNLDTIAVEMREQTKIMRVNSQRAQEQVELFIQYADKLTKPAPFPVLRIDGQPPKAK